ncbi:MAG: hypothetical protein LOD87_10230, partial [Planifilum fulgidum]
AGKPDPLLQRHYRLLRGASEAVISSPYLSEREPTRLDRQFPPDVQITLPQGGFSFRGTIC